PHLHTHRGTDHHTSRGTEAQTTTPPHPQRHRPPHLQRHRPPPPPPPPPPHSKMSLPGSLSFCLPEMDDGQHFPTTIRLQAAILVSPVCVCTHKLPEALHSLTADRRELTRRPLL